MRIMKLKVEINNVCHTNLMNYSADTWESVTTQPSCTICCKVFGTDRKRDEHIKFSVRVSGRDCFS